MHFLIRVDVNADVRPVGNSSQNTTLTAAVTKTATTITVASTTGFPTTWNDRCRRYYCNRFLWSNI